MSAQERISRKISLVARIYQPAITFRIPRSNVRSFLQSEFAKSWLGRRAKPTEQCVCSEPYSAERITLKASVVAVLLAISTCIGLTSNAGAFGGEDVVDGKPWHHEHITKLALNGYLGFSEQSAESIAWHADYLDAYQYNPLWWVQGKPQRIKAALAQYKEMSKLHFDDVLTTDGVRQTWRRYAAGTLVGIYWASLKNDIVAAHNVLGVSVHAVQDFYSHSNWVDNKARRCQTWHQTKVQRRRSIQVYSGVYEGPIGSAKHHGRYSFSCSLLKSDTFGQLLDAGCVGALNPFQNAPFCEAWRACRGSGGVTPSVHGSRMSDRILKLQPPGIALDTTWLAKLQAPNRGLTNEEGMFLPGKGGTYIARGSEQCRQIIGGASDCSTDSEVIFAVAKDLAVKATRDWVRWLDKAVNAMGAKQREFWAAVKNEGGRTDYRESQYESFDKVPFQFLSAGPYPVGNPALPGTEFVASAHGWYLRLTINTSCLTEDAGTNSDIFARVQGPGFDRRIKLDYLPTNDQAGRTNNRLLVYDDFEKCDNDAYTIGPFPEKPTHVSLENVSAGVGDIGQAIAHDLKQTISELITTGRRTLLGFIAGKADHVGDSQPQLIMRGELDQMIKIAKRGKWPEGDFTVDGGDEGSYKFTYRVRPMEHLLTDDERRKKWKAYEVQAHKLTCLKESKNDRGSTSDEPFVIFMVSPLNGQTGSTNVYLSPPFKGVDDKDERVFDRRTGSAHIIKLPPNGAVVLSVRIFESDNESQADREKLKTEFATGLTRAEQAPAKRFLDALGRAILSDWTVSHFKVFAFRRSGRPQAGMVLEEARPGTIKGGATRRFALNWSKVRPLLSPSLKPIHRWETGPPGADVLAGRWNVQNIRCGESLSTDTLLLAINGTNVTGTRERGDACAPQGSLAFAGKFEGGVLKGTLNEFPYELTSRPTPTTLPANYPKFQDTSVHPNIALEGNWKIKWENTDGGDFTGYATFAKGRAPILCPKEPCRPVDSKWGVSFYFLPGKGETAGSTVISSPGILETKYNHFWLGTWGGKSKGRVINNDRIEGEWSYGKSGPEVWERVKSEVISVQSLSDRPRDTALLSSRPVRVKSQYSGAGNDMRGNRPSFKLRLFGRELWGIHYVWMPPESDLELRSMRYICTLRSDGSGYPTHSTYSVCMSQGGVVGVEINIVVWSKAKPGRQFMYFDRQPIPFDLELERWPGIQRDIKLELAACPLLREIESSVPNPLVLQRVSD